MLLPARRIAPWFMLAALSSCNCDGLALSDVPGILVGTLCDIRTGQGRAGVDMTLALDDGTTPRTTSDTGGAARMENIPPGTYRVTFSQTLTDGTYTSRSQDNVQVKSGLETTVFDPACLGANQPPGTGWIRGRVCNRHTGAWVSMASVSILLENGELAATTTDADGGFVLQGVPAGEHTVYVRGTEFSRSYVVNVTDGRESSLDTGATCQGLDPNSGGVEGVLCAPNGTGPLAGATAYVDVGDPPVRLSDITDSDGYFIITGLPPGEHRLSVTQGSFNRTYLVTIVAGQMARIGPNACPPPGPETGGITGYFCNAGRPGPWVGALVTVETANGTLEDSTDAEGAFEFAGLAPGSYVVQVHNGNAVTPYTVTVSAGTQTSLIPQQSCGTVMEGPTGEIHGRICAPNGTTWLANARVWVDVPGVGTIETQTSAEGRFVLTGIPPGTYVVHVQAGSFTTDIPAVVVRANEITDLGDGSTPCVPIEDNHRIAVVSGEYDAVQDVLRRLGIENIDVYDGEGGGYQATLLEDYALMQTYDVIFFNCGMDDSFLSSPSVAAVALDNVRQYVASGRSVYASDWAYDMVEQAWPGSVEFVNNDATVDDAQWALGAENAPATVVDPGLRNALGQTDVVINFNLDAWAVMTAAGPGTRVYIRGDVTVCGDGFCYDRTELTNVPYTVGFHPTETAGKVIYTSFHQEQQTTADMDQILQLLIFEL